MQDLNEIIKEIKKQKEYYTKEKIRLKKKIAKLPRGSIQKKIIRNNTYYYLLYRDKGKITHDYLGKKVSTDLQENITKRQKLESELKPVNDSLSILRKLKI